MTRLGGTLVAAGLAVLVVALGWALYATGAFSFDAGSPAIIAIIVLGVVGTGALAGVFMWLAFYSARRGYDDAPMYQSPRDEAPPPAPSRREASLEV
jgi:cation transporter-like permease